MQSILSSVCIIALSLALVVQSLRPRLEPSPPHPASSAIDPGISLHRRLLPPESSWDEPTPPEGRPLLLPDSGMLIQGPPRGRVGDRLAPTDPPIFNNEVDWQQGSSDQIDLSPLQQRWLRVRLPEPGQSTKPVNEVVRYYDIQGSTEQELRRQLNTTRAAAGMEPEFDAYTKWTVNWKYKSSLTESSASISDAQVTVRVETVLPRWVNSSAAPPDLKEKWGRYITRLKEHEQGHRDTGVRAAQLIRDALLKTSISRPDSARLRNRVDGITTDIVRKCRRLDTSYDALTQHGVTQGAVFP